MDLTGLLGKRLVVLSGKGGVGKSVVGLALALAARRRGKRVLLVEVDAPLEASRHLGAGPVGPEEREIQPGLWLVNLDPRHVMDEYVRRKVWVEFITRRILASPVYDRFFTAAPGLAELMVLGKIMDLEGATAGRRPRFDLILVDAPATGHGLAFLKVPQAASKAIPVGPVGANARRIERLLQDRKRTGLVIVAIPEEMAVVEAVELHETVAREIGMHPELVVLNACYERRFSPEQEAEVQRLGARGAGGRLSRGVPLAGALAAARRYLRREKLSRFYERRLRRALPLPLVRLPYLFGEELAPDELKTLADRLEAA